MNRDDASNPLHIGRIHLLKSKGVRLTGDQVAALIDDADPTYQTCECGCLGLRHREGTGRCARCLRCKEFKARGH